MIHFTLLLFPFVLLYFPLENADIYIYVDSFFLFFCDRSMETVVNAMGLRVELCTGLLSSTNVPVSGVATTDTGNIYIYTRFPSFFKN